MIRRPPRSTQSRSSAASDVYKRQDKYGFFSLLQKNGLPVLYTSASLEEFDSDYAEGKIAFPVFVLSLIHISEPTRLGMISYAVFCLKKKKNKHLRAHETESYIVCRLLLEKKKKDNAIER